MRTFAKCTRRKPKRFAGGVWEYETLESNVEVMAIAKGHAMVRHPRCAPFVVSENELSEFTKRK
jgi:hypothetical protein